MAAYARSFCGPRRVRKGGIVTQGFTLIDKAVQTKATPITLLVIRRQSPTGGVQVLSQQYAWKTPRNILRFAADFPAGEGYEIEFGFYFRSELDEKYPVF
jgi:hypothetical protein